MSRTPVPHQKILWGRAAAHCSFPDCDKDLVEEKTKKDDYVILGEIAHICAKSPRGPRHDPTLSEQECDSYDNLILLCPEHHKIIDRQVETYTVERLLAMKRAHEQRMRREQVHEKKRIYSIDCLNAADLTPVDIMGSERGASWGGFKEYYYERKEDESFHKKLAAAFTAVAGSETKRHLLIKGRPLAGKSRMVYQWLKKEASVDMLLPPYMDVDRESFVIPDKSSPERRQVLLLDDLHRYVNFQHFDYLLKEFLLRSDITIIATCRSGVEYSKVENKLLESQIDLKNIFAEIEIKPIEEQVAREIAAKEDVGISWEEVEFNGTIGSVFLKLSEMRRRYEQVCTPEQRTILQAVKLAYLAGIFRGRQLFPIGWIQTICLQKFELEMKSYEWTELIRGVGIETEEEGAIKKASLERLEFLRVDRDEDLLTIEEVYLEEIIEPDRGISLADFKELKSVFQADPEALFLLGKQIWTIGRFILAKANYMALAIEVFELSQQLYKEKEGKTRNYARALGSVGWASIELAEIQDKAVNCKKAIKSCKEALTILTRTKASIDYATTQNNLGTAYRTLAEVEDTAKNCHKAIEAFRETLRIRTFEHFPQDYALTQNNLGTAYVTLAEVEEKKENCHKAIEAFRETLRVYTFESFPLDYALTQNNLGAVYRTLAEVENKAANCKKAITAFREALRVRTFEHFPIQYALTQNNLGNSHTTLAEVEEKKENCKKAIEAYKEALRVYTFESFPMYYALTQNNLGNAYQTLAEVEEKKENCHRAIKAYEEALRVRTFEHFPMGYAATQNNLGGAYATLAAVEEKAKNCQKAIEAFREALRVYTFEFFPMDYTMTQNNLGAAYQTLAKVTDKKENCQKAIEAFREALRVRTFERFPMQYALTQNNLGVAYLTLAEEENPLENCQKAIAAYEEALRIFTPESFPQQHNTVLRNLMNARSFCFAAKYSRL